MMTLPLASVVIVPREGFRQAPACLERLFEVTTTPMRLVYVDAGAPRRIARRLEQLIERHGGTLIRAERYVRPTDARNLGFAAVDTRYVVFLDNDVVVTPGWLDALISCADQTGAAFVSPIICIGGQVPPVVHVAGGVNRIVEEGGVRRFVETYARMGWPLAAVRAEVGRAPTTMAEFHAVLVRTESLRALGGLDERCSTAFEHNDLCLSLAARGDVGWLETASLVDYVQDSPAAIGNAQYHMLRWCRSWIDESLDGFCRKWNLRPDDAGFAESLRSLHGRRGRPIRRLQTMAGRIGGGTASRWVAALAEAWVERVVRRYHENRPPAVRRSRWPGAGAQDFER